MTAYSEPMRLTSPTLHATIWFTVAVFVAILVMSFVFKVEVVATGQGRVVPVGRVQVVQPEFAGKITAIHARNGMAVRQGDVLVELDPTDALAELGTLRAEADRLQIEQARLSAMVRALDLDPEEAGFVEKALGRFTVPDALLEHPYSDEQRRLLAAELGDMLASRKQIAAREETNRRSEAVTRANISRVEAALAIQAERFEVIEKLAQQGTASRATFLDTQQALADFERERDVYLRELDQKIAERAALDSERGALSANLRRSLLSRASDIDARLATLFEERQSAERRLKGAQLTAPASGIVDQLSIFTVGGIAEAGAELMRIVPTDTEIELEGTFSNQDIGFLEIGQTANIGLESYPAERFGFVKGRVVDIAADSTEVSEGQWGFSVKIEPDQPYLVAGAEQFTLRPGMTAAINVTTDDRRIISYFFAPIVQTVQNALGER